jgi:hypothetical protein
MSRIKFQNVLLALKDYKVSFFIFLKLLVIHISNLYSDAQSFYENCQEDESNKILSINLNSINNPNNSNSEDDNDSIGPGDSISIVGSNQDYNKPKNVNSIKTNKKVLIIQNIDLTEFNNDETVISVYAENLVPFNPIEKIEVSKLFANTYYIIFKNEFEFNNAFTRYKRRPSIGQTKIDIFEAFKTDSIVGCLENHKEYNTDIFEWHFSNRNKSGVDKYLKIQDCKPFVIIQFPDQKYVNTVLKNKHVFKNGALIPEILYNSKLVPNFDQQNK